MEHVIAVAYFAKYLDFIYLFINFKTCFGFYVRHNSLRWIWSFFFILS